MKLTRLLLLSCLASFSIGANAQEEYEVTLYVPGEDVIETSVSSKEDLEALFDDYNHQNTIAVFEDQIPEDWANLDNVVSNGNAKKIVLTNNEPYTYVGDPFEAEKVEFTFNFDYKATKRRFEDKSDLNMDYPPCQLWTSLAIPFDGVPEVEPFTNETQETGKYFARRFTGSDNFVLQFADLEEPKFEANQSYILAFPNDSYGVNEFLGNSLVITAEDVLVYSSESKTIYSEPYCMRTTYNGRGENKIYLLDYQVGIGFDYNEEGPDYVLPFSAYVMDIMDSASLNDARGKGDNREKSVTRNYNADIPIPGAGGDYLTLKLSNGDDVCFAPSVTLPTLDDDSFLGWAESATGLVVYDGGETINMSSGKTLYPKYGSVITLSDVNDVSVLSEVDGQTKNVRLTRTFPKGKKQTICLPFNPGAILTKGKVWEFTGIEDGKAVMTQRTSGLTANTPYIFEATNDLTSITFENVEINIGADPKTVDATADFTFHGTYEQKHWLATSDEVTQGKIYGFMAEDNDGQTTGQFVRARRETYLRPFSCYLEYNGELTGTQTATARRMTRADIETLPDVIDIVWQSAGIETTGIRPTPAPSLNGGEWYDLSGRRLSGRPSAKGIYIHNGRKEVVTH